MKSKSYLSIQRSFFSQKLSKLVLLLKYEILEYWIETQAYPIFVERKFRFGGIHMSGSEG